MEKHGGYAGNILKVDLSDRSIDRVPLSPDLVANFIGGAGINARLTYDATEPHAGPFSPQNALVFGVGPLVGTLAPGAGKSNITAKSPVSGFIGSSGSGHLGMLKFTGNDHLVVTGKADTPVYLKIGDDVEIRDAGHIWGKDTWEATDAIWNELGREYVVLSIGPAGENLVRDASVIANKYSAYARTGMGAVMGSKNLKAVAAYGTHGVTVAHRQRFAELVNRLRREINGFPFLPRFRHYGTLTALAPMVETRSFLYRNFRQAAGEDLLESFALDRFDRGTEHGNISCLSCPVGCKHRLRWKEGEYAGLSLSLSCAVIVIQSFVNCGILGWPEVLKCAETCNRLGMDYMSASCLVALAIELYREGIIDNGDTEGIALEWKIKTVLELLHAIAHRKGLGDVLANGLIEAPRRIGRGAEDYAVHFKGLGPVGDVRGSISTLAFSLLTNVTGHSSHINTTLYGGMAREKLERYCRRLGMGEDDMGRMLAGPEGYNPARLTKWAEDYTFVLECLGLCQMDLYQKFDMDIWADLYSAATGIEMDASGLLRAAARGRDMRKAFNIREGATRKDDVMPNRFLTESIQVGEAVRPPHSREYLDELVTEYYEERGWDPKSGNLKADRLAELGLA
ncbi:aldehyde ferredoxin oxidoreductase family protein [Chloroflexota bacterium]